MAGKKKDKTTRKKIVEYFNIRRKGKEKLVKSTGVVEEKSVGKKQIEQENRLLRNILIGLCVFTFLLVGLYVYITSFSIVEYKDVTYRAVQEGELLFYQTAFPVNINGTEATYNIYLRNNPKALEKKVPFNGDLEIKSLMVLNATSGFECEGYGAIAVANLVKLEIFGSNIIKDPEASCDPEGRYTFVQLQEGEENSIDQVGPSCYNLNIKGCDIVPVTERFMVEYFSEVRELIGEDF